MAEQRKTRGTYRLSNLGCAETGDAGSTVPASSSSSSNDGPSLGCTAGPREENAAAKISVASDVEDERLKFGGVYVRTREGSIETFNEFLEINAPDVLKAARAATLKHETLDTVPKAEVEEWKQLWDMYIAQKPSKKRVDDQTSRKKRERSKELVPVVVPLEKRKRDDSSAEAPARVAGRRKAVISDTGSDSTRRSVSPAEERVMASPIEVTSDGNVKVNKEWLKTRKSISTDTTVTPVEDSDHEPGLELLAENTGKSYTNIINLPVAELGCMLSQAIFDINEARLKCRNMNGQTHKIIKDNCDHLQGGLNLILKRYISQHTESKSEKRIRELELENKKLRANIDDLNARALQSREMRAVNIAAPKITRDIACGQSPLRTSTPLEKRAPRFRENRSALALQNKIMLEKDKQVADNIERCNNLVETLLTIRKELQNDRDSIRDSPVKKSRGRSNAFNNNKKASASSSGRPRIIEDVQIAPARETLNLDRETETDEPTTPLWTEVLGRRAKKRKPPKVPKKKPPRPSRRAVVAVSTTADMTAADALRIMRDKIDLAKLNIERTSIRRSAGGKTLITVHGDDCASKADKLAQEARGALQGTSAEVHRPVRRADMRVSGFDESVSVAEIVGVVATAGKCDTIDITVGRITKWSNGLGVCRINLPLDAAIAATATGHLRLGWTSARAELIPVRPLQCFKCWQYGHMKNACTSAHDRTGRCFKCGKAGHTLSSCTDAPDCPVCRDAELPANHRIGADACQSYRRALENRRRAGNRNNN